MDLHQHIPSSDVQISEVTGHPSSRSKNPLRNETGKPAVPKWNCNPTILLPQLFFCLTPRRLLKARSDWSNPPSASSDLRRMEAVGELISRSRTRVVGWEGVTEAGLPTDVGLIGGATMWRRKAEESRIEYRQGRVGKFQSLMLSQRDRLP